MDEKDEITSMGGCLARVFWIFSGPAMLFLFGVIIVTQQLSLPTGLDVTYGVVLILIIVSRFIDRPKLPKSPSGSPVIDNQSKEIYRAGILSAVRDSVIILLVGSGFLVLVHFVLKGLI